MVGRLGGAWVDREVLQTVYAIWVVSYPLGWHWQSTLVFCVVIVVTMARENLVERDELRSPGWLRRLLVVFLHRNYCLHVGLMLAMEGADPIGRLTLLGVGACTDALREECVVCGTPRVH